MPVPELFLHEDCDHHDFDYWRGGSWWDRWLADWRFYKRGVKKAGWNPLKQGAILIYFAAVRFGGEFCFHYGDRQRDERDIEDIMKNYGQNLSKD